MFFDTKEIIWVITVILTFIGYVPYVRDIFRGKTKPHLYSWFIWGIFALIIFSIQIQNNAGAGSWMTGFVWMICMFITALSLKYGTKNMTKVDHIFLWGVTLAILSWFLVDEVAFSLILICVIDVLWFLPTIRKSWSHPYEETLSLYSTAALRHGLAIFALSSYSFNTVFYLLLWTCIDICFCIYLLRRRSIMKK